MRLRTSPPEGSAHVKTGGDRSREHSPAQASGSQTGRAQHSGGDEDLPRPLPVGSTHHGGPRPPPSADRPEAPGLPSSADGSGAKMARDKDPRISEPARARPCPGMRA